MAAALAVGDIATKLRGEPDDSGDLYFAVALDDDEGFERTDLTLLSDKRYIPHRDFLAIARWQVESADVM